MVKEQYPITDKEDVTRHLSSANRIRALLQLQGLCIDKLATIYDDLVRVWTTLGCVRSLIAERMLPSDYHQKGRNETVVHFADLWHLNVIEPCLCM